MLRDQKSLAQFGVGLLVCCTPPPRPTQEFILTTQHPKGVVWAGPKPPPPSYKIGPNCCFGALAQLIHVVACFVLCTAFFVLPLLPPSACCILGPYTTAMACMFLQWTKPEAALPQSFDSMHGTAARSHPFGEMPLHAMAKAAAFLPSQSFEKGLEPPLGNSVWQLLFAGDLFFFTVALTIAPKKLFSAPKKSAPAGWGLGGPNPPTHPERPHPHPLEQGSLPPL